MEKALNEFMGEVMTSMEKRLNEAEHIFVVAYKKKADDLQLQLQSMQNY